MKAGFEYPFIVPPIYYAYEEGARLENVQAEILDVVNKIKFGYKAGWGETQKLSTKDFSDNTVLDYDMKYMQACIAKHVKEYCKHIKQDCAEYDILSSWLTLNEKGDYSSVHNHVPCDLSGCYYFSTDGDDGDIYFNNPITDSLRNTKIYGTSAFEEVWEHKPAVGKLLLFPSFLQHGVRRNTHDTKRISLAFNINLRSIK